MSILTIHNGQKKLYWEYLPPKPLSEVLETAGFPEHQPCGGRGICEKCAAKISGAVSRTTVTEATLDLRLICQTTLLGDATVILPERADMTQIQTDSSGSVSVGRAMVGAVGAAVDIGTTTIALKRYDLVTGNLLGQSAMENPQVTVAADVIGRIDVAMKGNLRKMQSQVRDALAFLLEKAGGSADVMVVTGNTTMLYLLEGKDPSSLSSAPFEADCLFDYSTTILDTKTYLPPCIDAFVGADISCAVLSSGMCKDRVSLLCDIGTNGEVALWKDGFLYVTSTAAGPAFEGAGVSCGCGSIPGAIDKVWIERGKLRIHTIREQPPIGICGSGIVDTVAKLLETEGLDETGVLEEEAGELAPGLFLTQKDIRMVQLAKAAISAGIRTLLTETNTDFSQIETCYLAGGFGSHLNIENAVAVGLIPQELKTKVNVVGNAALAGASQLLLDAEKINILRHILSTVKSLNLSGNSVFAANYVEQMLFTL